MAGGHVVGPAPPQERDRPRGMEAEEGTEGGALCEVLRRGDRPEDAVRDYRAMGAHGGRGTLLRHGIDHYSIDGKRSALLKKLAALKAAKR